MAEYDNLSPGPPVSGTVRIVNLEASGKDITLTNGDNVRLAPFSKNGTAHISEPVPKKLIPQGVKKMITRRWVRLDEEVAK